MREAPVGETAASLAPTGAVGGRATPGSFTARGNKVQCVIGEQSAFQNEYGRRLVLFFVFNQRTEELGLADGRQGAATDQKGHAPTALLETYTLSAQPVSLANKVEGKRLRKGLQRMFGRVIRNQDLVFPFLYYESLFGGK